MKRVRIAATACLVALQAATLSYALEDFPLLTSGGAAVYYRPAGWLYFSWPYAYDNTLKDWFYYTPTDQQWVYGYAPAPVGWNALGASGLATGWSYQTWPWAYDSDSRGWFYMNEIDTQWCVNLRTGQWAIFGRPSTTPPVPDSMVLIPAGSFQMGNAIGEGGSDELPVHTVSVSVFYIDKFEVTKGLWDEVRAWGLNNGYTDLPAGSGKGTDHPMSGNWYTILKWCNARSEREGRRPVYYLWADESLTLVYRVGDRFSSVDWTANGYRLPTEAEWEKAARGGVSGWRFPWGDTIQHTRANYRSYPACSYDTSATLGYHPDYDEGEWPYTSPVGSFAPNGYGLYDMAGNGYEWCWDCWDGSYYGTSPASDPRGPAAGSFRVMRGGNYSSHAYRCRVADRENMYPDSGSCSFRVVLPGQ